MEEFKAKVWTIGRTKVITIPAKYAKYNNISRDDIIIIQPKKLWEETK